MAPRTAPDDGTQGPAEAREEAIRKLEILRDAATGALADEGGRGGPGDRALPHVEDAMAVLKVINRNLGGRPEGELLEELRMVERCLRRASAELALDYGRL